MLNYLLSFLIRKPIWSLTLFLIAVGVSLLQIQNFSVDASSESLSLEGDNNLALYFETQKTFDEEIPSHVFNHKNPSAFKNYLENFKNFF